MLQSDDLQDPLRIRTSGRLLMGRAFVNGLPLRLFPEGLLLLADVSSLLLSDSRAMGQHAHAS
jgi:hypothetical protein